MILALPAVLAALAVLLSRAAPWREACLRALAAFGAAAAILTEALGLSGMIRPGALGAAWGALAVAAFAAARRIPRKRRHAGSSRLVRYRITGLAALAGIAAIAMIVGFTAVSSPPNSADAMAYHMPRVVYWAQARNVDFFPTPYYNQVMLPPLAEYLMLHTYVLSGGDRWINLVQFLGMLGSVVAVSLVAQALGAGRRGQVLAALFAATLPNGILQASGAKNDYLLACWLATSVWMALRFRREPSAWNAAWLGAAVGLALLTKSTAYLFAPPMILAALLAGPRPGWRQTTRGIALAAVCAIALNAPQFLRNIGLSGSPLGFDSAHGDGRFRWRNEPPSLGAMTSNALRNLSEQAGARSLDWNRGVHRAVTGLHGMLGLDPNDPRTTFPGARYEPPRNANHEANAANRWHLLLFAIAAPAACFRARLRRRRLWYCAGIAGAFLLFCGYLKWQPFFARLELPLFVGMAPIAGIAIERLRPKLVQLALVLFFLNNSRPYLFENWTRPLRGPDSIFRATRERNYFRDMVQWNNRSTYLGAVAKTLASGCRDVGIDISENQLEYPYQALLLRAAPDMRFRHTGVKQQEPPPCAVLCLDCEKNLEKIRLYKPVGEPFVIGRFLLFIRPAG